MGAALFVPQAGFAQELFKENDHVVIIGGGLADRMQHDGWTETFLQTTYPNLNLVIRNQGYTGDRINLRPRNQGFLTSDEYLSLSRANIVLAMFGFNESFDHDLSGFETALDEWITHTQTQNYSGAGAPKIVLFSPTAFQNLRSPNLPDGVKQNQQLARCAAVIEQVAKQHSVVFVDLFTQTLHHFAMAKKPLTINGVHLNEDGHRLVGKLIAEKLSKRKTTSTEQQLQKIREAVLDKNWHWFNRYRATDGNDVWGSRAGLKFSNEQTNREVLQHELVQLDLMSANRDRVIWAAANGKEVVVNDSNVPPAIDVESNLSNTQLQGGVSKVGDGNYLGGEEALEKMTVAQGLSVNLFASEEMFPELVNPVQLGVGPRGRIWAAAWRTYPKWEPLKKMEDRLLILPDENRNGVADKAITFAYVHNPTGFEFWNGGVVVASAPDLLFLKDTDGDDIADVRYRLLGGIDSADTHHTANNFFIGPDGFLYYQRGVFHVSNVETPWSANQQSGRSGMYRFNPRTFEFSFHADNSPNPHGISFDYWGYHYATDATGGRAYQVVPNDTQNGFEMRKLFNHTVRPVASSGILSSAHLPEKYQGNFTLCNTIAFLGIKQYFIDIDEITGEAIGRETENLLVSSDPNFRPTDLEIGDDGAIYVSDWCNPIVGHMQHNVRDPERDHAHGRIYRLTADGRDLSEHIDVVGQPITALLELLKNPINGIRQRVRAELSGHDSQKVIEATQQWIKQFDFAKAEDAHHLLEALWLHQQHNIANPDLLKRMLNSPVAHARNAARRVKQMWNKNSAPTTLLAAESQHNGLGKTPPSDAIVIRTVPEEMRYDIESFTVSSGEAVKLWFENTDFMPHNLVIGMPDSANIIGPAAEALGASGFDKAFIPDSELILVASKLLNHEDVEVLEFTAPTTPGDYDFICTFPGHWQLMRGVMKVRAKKK